jgi:ribonucleotide monophosphatase NagD (HAD superfamily)
MLNNIVLSQLAHTWILDVDGTLCVHNGYKHGGDTILDGVKEFFAQIPSEDMIILLTSRTAEEERNLVAFMQQHGLRYDHIIFNAPMGERILINDAKPSGLKTAYALNKQRDASLEVQLTIDEKL